MKPLLILLLSLSTLPLLAQNVGYSYDAAGNRIARGLSANRDTSFLVGNTAMASNIKVYPNPTQDILQVDVGKELPSDAQVLLYDTQGRLLLEQALPSYGSTTLQVAAYPTGTYLLQVRTKEEQWQWTVVKE